VDDEIIESNPLYGWSYKRREPVAPNDDIDPFTPAEQAAILDALEGQGLNLIQFAFWTGLRTNELVALEWGDIDWIRGIILITRGQTQAAEEPEAPKTRAGRRELKILSPAMAALTNGRIRGRSLDGMDRPDRGFDAGNWWPVATPVTRQDGNNRRQCSCIYMARRLHYHARHLHL